MIPGPWAIEGSVGAAGPQDLPRARPIMECRAPGTAATARHPEKPTRDPSTNDRISEIDMNPTFGGSFVFGTACHVVHSPHPIALQKDGFFGLTGMTSLFGGGRGRIFEVTGVLVGPDLPTVIAAEGVLLSFADGIARTFVDTQERAWPNVVFEGEYQPSPEGPKPTDFGWCLPYRCILHGLT